MSIYSSMLPSANKYLNSDGSITDLEGNVIEEASEEGAKLFKSMSPQVNKILNPDGSVSTLSDIPTRAEKVSYTNNGQTSVEGALDSLFDGGGGGGDYATIANKPQIDGHTLNAGNNTSDTLGLQTKLTFDNIPQYQSINPVTSGGVFNSIQEINNNIKSIKPLFIDVEYPAVSNNYLIGNIIEVSNETELINAINGAANYDTIKLTADITLTSTLTINKSLKIDGNFVLQSAGSSTDPVVLIDVTANNVYLTENITIKHRKTSNTSIETAIRVNASNFISYANVEFMEFGYVLRGSFNIQGNIAYTGVASNSNRAITIYKISGNSIINKVIWNFVDNATPVSNFIFLGYVSVGDVLDYNLKISNCFQSDITKRGRQFIFYEVLTKTIGATPSLIVENNRFNCLNGDIGFNFSATQDISFFEYIALFNNWSGSAGYNANSYKGLCFCDGSGTLRNLNNTKIYTSGNINYPIVRSSNDYTSAIGKSVLTFKNTVFINNIPLVREQNLQVENSQYNWIKNIDDCLTEVVTDSTLTGKGTKDSPLSTVGGVGTVSSVNDILPDLDGNILLTSKNLNTIIGIEIKTQQEFNEEILDASLSFEIDV